MNAPAMRIAFNGVREAGRRFHRSDLDAWIRAGGILAFKRAEG